ncbi:MAG: hypothetical protein Q4D07_06240 [Selenomonadaceae bacterium]|nr:hypothetical protein [Selenomonadaceae bacterium]
MLIDDYLEAVQARDVLRQSHLMLAIIDEAKSGKSTEINRSFVESRKDAIAFYMWQAIVDKDEFLVKRWLEHLVFGNGDYRSEYLLGRALLLLGDGAQAETKISAYVTNFPQADEEAIFHLGNAYLLQGKYKEAFETFCSAVQERKSFAEAGANAVYAYSMLTGDNSGRCLSGDEKIDKLLGEGKPFCNADASSLNINEEDMEEVRNLPIFINSRDRVGCLMMLVEWLLNAGYRNLIIIDNDSSYPPLLNYYNDIEKDSRIRVVRLGKNIGHTALWDSGILEDLDIKTPYAYTDSDLLPLEECPANFVQELLRILRKYPSLKKAGPGLYLDDLQGNFAVELRSWQEQFYSAPIEAEIYYGAVDTTFAVYRNIRSYVVMNSVRTKGRIQMRHLPWYYDGYDDMPEDEQYYARHANRSSNVGRKAFEEKFSSIAKR